eukprot:1028135-Rhodomonas_salina.3
MNHCARRIRPHVRPTHSQAPRRTLTSPYPDPATPSKLLQGGGREGKRGRREGLRERGMQGRSA